MEAIFKEDAKINSSGSAVLKRKESNIWGITILLEILSPKKLRDIDKELGFEENPLNSAQKSATRSNLSSEAKSTNPQELLK